MSDMHDVVVIGSGPAGYTAALYAARADLNPVVVTGALAPGGQLVNTSVIENFPGFPDGIEGPELMDRMRAQAERFGAEFRATDASSVTRAGDGFDVTLADGSALHTRTVIAATGSEYRKLGVPGEQEFAGHGVSYCATCDGFFFKDKPVVVVGGGDSACEEALFLTRFASSVTLIHRRSEFRASALMVSRVKAHPKITVLTNAQVSEIRGGAASAEKPTLGQIHRGVLPQIAGGTGSTVLNGAASASTAGHVESVIVRDVTTGDEREIEANGVFIAIGSTPATDCLNGLVELDAQGYIVTKDASTRTSVEGVFAAGDCADPTYRQAVSAAGMGCRAALDAQAYLAD